MSTLSVKVPKYSIPNKHPSLLLALSKLNKPPDVTLEIGMQIADLFFCDVLRIHLTGKVYIPWP